MLAKQIKETVTIDFFAVDTSTELSLPLAESIHAGFPSPAADYMEIAIDLNKELIKNPTSTFFGRVKGLSMQDADIHEGDVLVIDKSLEPANGKIAVCFLDGEFTLKRIKKKKDGIYLMPANKDFEPIKIAPDDNFMVWGIVTYIIKKM